ncbi:MAG: TolC family protein [Deltaproteobacteria bacterium]|nr:MAG: TolC family protein [Deltaproteobacteria bacterium]
MAATAKRAEWSRGPQLRPAVVFSRRIKRGFHRSSTGQPQQRCSHGGSARSARARFSLPVDLLPGRSFALATATALILSIALLPAVAPAASDAARPWTLAQAIEHALRNNPEALLAEQRIAGARALLEQADAEFMPRIALRSSYSRTDNPALVFASVLNQKSFRPTLDFNDVPDVDNARVSGVVTLPLYLGGSRFAARRAAAASRKAAEREAQAVRNRLEFEVARTYYGVLKTREFVRAAQAAVDAFEHNLAVARNHLGAGTLLKTDVLDVEVRLAQAREDLARARNAGALARRALANLIGGPAVDLAVAGAVPEPAVPQDDDYSRRPELIAVGLRVEAARAALKQAESGYLPRVSAFGSADYDRGWELGGGAWSYTAGVSMEWSLWDGNRTASRVAEARAALEAARQEERRLRLAIDLEVEQARLRLNEANERLAVTEKAVAKARESAELTRSRFEEGLAISTQLIDAEAALTQARVRRAEAVADRRIAIGALRQALGLPQLGQPLPGEQAARQHERRSAQ